MKETTNDVSSTNFELQNKIDSDGEAAAEGAGTDQEQNDVAQLKTTKQ